VTWHLVGHLQSNKAKAAVTLFDLIHSVDDVELATALDRHAAALGKRQRVLFQVNVSGEARKSGFTPAELRTAVEHLAALPHLQPEGLMTIAPQGAGEEALRGIFRALRLLRDQLAPAFPGGLWRHLSMGMTDDYEIAVEEGATLVRVGRAIFGERLPGGAGASGKH
jgi:pyridoxal phosphate enzyme (YggS family)